MGLAALLCWDWGRLGALLAARPQQIPSLPPSYVCFHMPAAVVTCALHSSCALRHDTSSTATER